MKRRAALEVLNRHLSESLVVCHFGPTRAEWFDVSDGRQTFFMHGGMGMASSIGLGMAMGFPHRQVWVLEGDGALALNLGSLLTTAQFQPTNLTHFVMSNKSYEAVGSQPVAGGNAPLTAMAKAAGLKAATRIGDLETLDGFMTEREASPGYAFVELDIEEGSATKSKMPWDPVESKYRFGRYLEESEGVPLFPQ